MRELYNTLKSIKDTSSKTGKEHILLRYKDDELLTKTLKFLFDDLIVSGISKKKIAKPIKAIEPTNTDINNLLTYLKTHNTGRDADVSVVKGYINTYKKIYGQEIADMVTGIVTKDYPIGISKVTINKVYGKNFIFKFDVRKGSKFEGKLKPNVEYAQTIKLDGIRSIFLVDENGVKVFGRSGKEIKGLVVLEEALAARYEDTQQPMMYDGELLAFNPDNLPSDELFKVTTGKIRRDGNKYDIKFTMFDCMPLDEFRDGKSQLTWKKRREQVEQHVEELNNMIEVTPEINDNFFGKLDILYQGKDLTEFQRVQKEVEEAGHEGTMLDEVNAYYTASRTKTLLKYKTFHTVDLRVLRVEEHTRGNKLGSIVVDYKGYELGVGSGFSDKQRKLYWENKDLIKEKIVEVGYFELSKNDKGGESLRFPTFKGVRNDKNEVSYD